MERKQHWEKIYETNTDQDVGWYQENPETSLKLIEKYTSKKESPIIDVGGGNSHLSRVLFENGYTNLTVADISLNALKRSESRFGSNAHKLNWIESDVLQLTAIGLYHTWQDRAVFHFLLNEDEIKKYAEVAARSIVKGGYLILGTFSLTGPKMCSGLPISQYSEEDFRKVFGKYFELVECFDDVHITPTGNPQNFIWVVFKRV